MVSEIDDVKNLPPEQRVKRLKEIEEERRREIEEAESLIRDSFLEIKDREETKHRPKSVELADDISSLISEEEKQIFRTARFEASPREQAEAQMRRGGTANLEEVAHEAAKGREVPKGPVYGSALDEARKGVDYTSRVTGTGQVIESKKEGEIYQNSSQQQGAYARQGHPEMDNDPSQSYARKKQQQIESGP